MNGKTKLIKGSMKEPNQDWGAGVTYRSRYAYLKMLGISAGMPDIVDQIEEENLSSSSQVTIPTQRAEREIIEFPPVTPEHISEYLGDLVKWAGKHPTLLPGLKVAYKQEYPDFTGSFTEHVQEPHHIEFIDRYTNRLT